MYINVKILVNINYIPDMYIPGLIIQIKKALSNLESCLFVSHDIMFNIVHLSSPTVILIFSYTYVRIYILIFYFHKFLLYIVYLLCNMMYEA